MPFHEHVLTFGQEQRIQTLNVSVQEGTEKKEAWCSALGAMLWAFYKLFPSFAVVLLLHTSFSFTIDRRSGGTEGLEAQKAQVSSERDFLCQRELFPSFNARKDELPASGGAELVLHAAVAHRVA